MVVAVPGDVLEAQDIPSPYRFVDTNMEAGLYAGRFLFSSKGLHGIGPKPGPFIGGRYGIVLGGPFSLEGNVTYGDTERDVKDPGPDGDLTVIGQAPVQLLTLDARVKFMVLGSRTWHRISPHALFGAGITFDLSPQSPLDEVLEQNDRFIFGNSFTGVLGLGVRWFLSDKLLLRPDLTFQMWKEDIPAGYLTKELLLASPNGVWVQNWSLAIGLSYNF